MPKWIDFLVPPSGERRDDVEAVTSWRWAVFVVMVGTLGWIVWAMGLMSALGLGTGLARADDTTANRVAIQQLGQTIKCGALQTEIATLRNQIFELERIVSVDGAASREIDRRRLAELRNDVRDSELKYATLECAAVLQ